MVIIINMKLRRTGYRLLYGIVRKKQGGEFMETRRPKRGRTGGGEAGEGSRCGRRTDE